MLPFKKKALCKVVSDSSKEKFASVYSSFIRPNFSYDSDYIFLNKKFCYYGDLVEQHQPEYTPSFSYGGIGVVYDDKLHNEIFVGLSPLTIKNISQSQLNAYITNLA